MFFFNHSKKKRPPKQVTFAIRTKKRRGEVTQGDSREIEENRNVHEHLAGGGGVEEAKRLKLILCDAAKAKDTRLTSCNSPSVTRPHSPPLTPLLLVFYSCS